MSDIVFYNDTRFVVMGYTWIEDYGELYDKNCRLLVYDLLSVSGERKLLIVRLNYPPDDYRQQFSQQTSLAIDTAFDTQLLWSTQLYREGMLNIDKELKKLPQKIRKYFKFYLIDNNKEG